ncbi:MULTISPECIES: hypothetical protein [Prauserella]|nr:MULTISPECIES: hypothetical protein [Prauserella]
MPDEKGTAREWFEPVLKPEPTPVYEQVRADVEGQADEHANASGGDR